MNSSSRRAVLLQLVLKKVQILNLDIIKHTFLETGHRYMEVDSMHSAIEKQKKNVLVYTIQDWLTIFRFARSNNYRRYQKIKPVVIEYKYDHNETYKEINVFGKGWPINLKEVNIKKVYKSSLPISLQKKKDLLNLYKSGVIRDEFHHYYKSLKTSKAIKNQALQPDINDDTESDED